MNKSLFRYIWRHSRREQLIIFMVVLASLPFYYASLDLPRKIVNEAIQGRAFEKGNLTARLLEFDLSAPAWLGGGSVHLFDGFEVGRLQLLLGLSFVFLFLVLVNGWFKYWINVAKGALGERMMRRMRFELFSMALRFTPEALRTVKSSEAATIIKDEVEPIGGFIGDAFIQPLFLGTQAVTALLFIVMQSAWLGGLAAAVVGVQFVIIPRMRRELLRLGRMRQLASRRLAGRIGEVIDGIEAVQVHGTGRWERAEIGGRLYELFDIRFKIYKRKFIVKFLNNLLAQTTPFFFYAVGGYFALQGRLDIGQLVAVISAYRELPPPLKELIDWDQQRLDVQVKYDQVVGYFAAERLVNAESGEGEAADLPAGAPLVVEHLTILDQHGTPVIADANLTLTLPARLAVLGDGQAPSAFARALGDRGIGFAGHLRVGDADLSSLSASTRTRGIAYAGVDAILFPGTLRSNLLYGLRSAPPGERTPDESDAEATRVLEARRTGNPEDSADEPWIVLGRTAAADTAELDALLIRHLKAIGLEGEIYRFGLNGLIDRERHPALGGEIVDARNRLRERLEAEGLSDLVEPFDPESYNTHATVAENLLFGVPVSRDLMGRALAEHEGFREALGAAKLTDDLVAMGIGIAETMTDIFRGLPPGHPLFDQFSFIHADEIDDYDALLKSLSARRRGGPTRDERTQLLALPLAYVEPRHRLGLIDDAMRDRLLAGRKAVRTMLDRQIEPGVAFYDPAALNPAAPVRDNLLFGRVNEGIADAREQIRAAGAAIIDEMSLRDDIERVGLDHQVGPAGRLLTAQQRAGVNLIRCAVRRPDILIVDGALAPFGEKAVGPMLEWLVDVTGPDRTLVAVLPNEGASELFDARLSFDGARATLTREPAGGPVSAAAE